MKPSHVEITIRSKTGDARVDRERVRRTVECVLENADWNGEGVSLVFVDDDEITEIHGEFLDDATPTDVITFDLRDPDLRDPDMRDAQEPMMEASLGAELVLSVETAARSAAERDHSLERELQLYVVHGLCHLLGEDDHDPEQREHMRARERFFFECLGVPYPY